MGGGGKHEDEDGTSMSDEFLDAEQSPNSKSPSLKPSRSSTFSEFPPKIVDVLISEGIYNSLPTLNILLRVWENEYFTSLFSIGQKNKFLNIFLQNDSFWMLVPPTLRATMFEVFFKNDIKSSEEVSQLSTEELLSLEGLPSNVDELLAKEMIKVAEQEIQDHTKTIGLPLPPPHPPASLGDDVGSEHRSMEEIECGEDSSHLMEGLAISTDLTLNSDQEGTSTHGVKRKSHSAVPVLKLMELCSDRQNGGLVEKVILSPQEIKNFCDYVTPKSCSVGSTRIDFTALDKHTQMCYGVCGEREAILNHLRKVGALSASPSASDTKEFLASEAGIYGITVTEGGSGTSTSRVRKLYVVLWPRKGEETDIRPSSVTTTLMRYLTQLCNEVTVCLGEASGRNFPDERKQRKPRRRGKYQIGRELVEEESFGLLPGFHLKKDDHGEGDRARTFLIPAVDGIAILSCVTLPAEWSWNSVHFNLPLGDGKHEGMQRLVEAYDTKLDESMLIDERIDFFSNFSPKCFQLVQEFRISERDLHAQHKAENVTALKEVEPAFMHLSNDIETVLLQRLSIATSQIWPVLGAGICPDVSRESVEGVERRLADEGIKAWELFEKIINPVSFYGLNLSFKKRIVLCVVVFVDLKADAVSADRVWGFLTWKWWKIQEDLQESRGILGWRGRKKLSPTMVSKRIEEVMKTDSYLEILANGGEDAAALATALQKSFLKMIREEKLTVLREVGFTLEKMKLRCGNQMHEKHMREIRCVQREWVERVQGVAFVRPTLVQPEGMDVIIVPETAVPNAQEEKKERVEIMVTSFKKGYWGLKLEAKKKQVDEPLVKISVFQLAAGQKQLESLSEEPHESVQPKASLRGSFNMPLSSTIIAAWLLKDRLVLVAVHVSADGAERSEISSIDPRTGVERVLKKIPRGITLVSFDDQLRLVALYVHEFSEDVRMGGVESDHDGEPSSARAVSRSDIVVFRFDETFQQLSLACKQCELKLLAGEPELSHLVLLPGCHLLAILDVSNRIRFFHVRQQCVLSQSLQLPSDFRVESLLATGGGQCLMAVSTRSLSGGVRVIPYISPSYTALDIVEVEVAEEVGGWAVAAFGGQLSKQEHLCSIGVRNEGVVSHVIKETSRAQSQVITQQGARVEEDAGMDQIKVTFLEYFFYVFDKFPIVGAVESGGNGRSEVKVVVVFDCSMAVVDSLRLPHHIKRYLEGVCNDLRNTKKPMEMIDLLDGLHVSSISDGESRCSLRAPEEELVGEWLQRLICLVPIQIARAEENRFLVLSDGVLLPEEHARSVKQCVEGIRLGMYAAIFDWWKGPVLAVSSMGKQSTGKSYTLYHLFGISFEISGARCTDGCWLTLRKTDSVLYVVLDFEGLGSFERTDQEDMLLSVFNAALSGLTLFKTEYRLDRDIEQMFGRFQAGVGLIKGDGRLFKGHLGIVIKDVMARDVESVSQEFLRKIGSITAPDSSSTSEKDNNFISVMYDGGFTILPFPPLGEESYYEELRTIRQELDERPIQFGSGAEFAECMKTVMAKILLKDWSSLERQAIESRLQYLIENIDAVIQTGQTNGGGGEDSLGEEQLVCLDSQEPIGDKGVASYLSDEHPLKAVDDSENLKQVLKDISNVLPPAEDAARMAVFMSDLSSKFEGCGHKRSGKNHKVWFRWLSELVGGIVRRRAERVEEWVGENLVRFERKQEDVDGLPLLDGESNVADGMDDEARKFLQIVVGRCRQLQKQWQICGVQCNQCFLQCLSPRGHEEEAHSCMGSHACTEFCHYCFEEGGKGACGEKMGHSGHHDCRLKDHTCGKSCSLQECLDCNGICSKKAGHDVSKRQEDENMGNDELHVVQGGDVEHLCSALVHLCGKPCSADRCKGRCQMAHGRDHTVHKCMEGVCTHTCSVGGCKQSCSARDHFHGSPLSIVFAEEGGTSSMGAENEYHDHHYCGQPHSCSALCECDGVCKVAIEMVQEEEEEFVGARGTFKYRTVAEANGERKECSIPIPPFEKSHHGAHRHSRDPTVVHYCDEKCPTCLYFCEQAFGHEGPHSGAHGMMRNCFFVSDTKEIDVGTRKYVAGESGRAEMCDMFCRTLGRGHIHITPCDSTPSTCTHAATDGRRHETCRYGPDEHVPKDETTHENHWATVGWKDPCSAAERKEFSLCGASCGHASHMEASGTISYCNQPLWHPSADRTSHTGPGHVSVDGHTYGCSHPGTSSNGLYHAVLVLDDSGSMMGRPWSELVAAVQAFLGARASGGSEDFVTIIQHDDTARIIVEATSVAQAQSTPLRMRGMGNDFSFALQTAIEVMQRSIAFRPLYQPLLLFMSDGVWHNGEVEMRAISSMGKIQVYTIGFGSGCDFGKMESLAHLGGGICLKSVTGFQLKEAFLAVSSRMETRVSLVAQ